MQVSVRHKVAGRYRRVITHFAGVLLTLLLSSCTDSPPSVEVLGTLERDAIVLRATSAEIIDHIAVVEGQFVEPGQLLMQLNRTRQEALVHQADAQERSFRAVLDKLRNGARPEDVAAAQAVVNRAQARVTEATKNFKRASNLSERELIGEAELDAARAQQDTSKASLDDAREKLLRLTNGTRAEDLAQSEAQWEAAQAHKQVLQQDLTNLSVTATRAALVDSLPSHQGERVNLGQPLVVLLADVAPYARVYIPEPKRATIAVGDELQVHVDGIEEAFWGRVSWLSTEPAFTPYYALTAKDRARLVYEAKIQLPETARALPAGLPAQALLTE